MISALMHTSPRCRIYMVGGLMRMTNVNHSLSVSKTRNFFRFFVNSRGKVYTFIFTIYDKLSKFAAMLLKETCSYQVTIPKSMVNIPK
jgi:hypothetical protein